MEFTYQSYRNLIGLLRENDFQFCSYHNWQNCERSVIMRHDIDYDITKSVELAKIESEENIASTYFVLLTSDFYNVFSKKNSDQLKQIAGYGHEIGLHFDEMCYSDIEGLDGIVNKIMEEAEVLSYAIGEKVKAVSMHRPSKKILDGGVDIPGIVNSYSNQFFKEFKYLSDSRRRWRESVEDVIEQGFPRLHILTHAFWYINESKDIHDTISQFINCGNLERYRYMSENITDLAGIMSFDEVVCK